MARNAQMLIDMAAAIIHSVTTSEGVGLRNQLYSSPCPKPMLPMLTSMVNGSAANKDALLATAEEDGLFSKDNLPVNCLPLSDHLSELTVVLYECLLGSRRVRGTSPIVALVKSRKASLQKTLAARRKRGATSKFEEKKAMPRFQLLFSSFFLLFPSFSFFYCPSLETHALSLSESLFFPVVSLSLSLVSLFVSLCFFVF